MSAEVAGLIQQGRAARSKGDHAAALAAFEAVPAIDPNHLGAKADAASALRALGRIDDAEATCRKVLAIDPNHAATLAELGYIARERGDRSAALAAFEAAIAAHPAHVNLNIQAAIELRVLGRLEEAEALCQRVLAIEPAHVATLIEIGHIERRRGNRSAALTAINRAIEAQPNHLGLKAQAASDLRELERYDEAEALCRELDRPAPCWLPCRSWQHCPSSRRPTFGTRSVSGRSSGTAAACGSQGAGRSGTARTREAS